ncbi:MAG: radical SAM protein, partial [Candidatus Kariarchaeaceae archaeon]
MPSLTTLPGETISRLPRRIDHPLAAPTVEFLVTNRCNLKCRYCYSYFGAEQEDISPDIAVSFLDAYIKQQQSHNINPVLRHFVFSGGEPTLNPDAIFEVLEYIDSNGIKCIPMILTNGVISSNILDRLIEMKFCFQISFDGNNNQHRVTPTGRNVNDQIVNTIKQVAADGLPVEIRSVISKENVSCMVDIVEFAADNQVESVLFA